jgi:hypothetical protein
VKCSSAAIVADAEDEDAETNQRDHDKHHRRQRIEDEAKSERLFAKGEPSEIVECPVARRLQSRPESGEGKSEPNDLSGNCETAARLRREFVRLRMANEGRERQHRDQPEMSRDPVAHPLSWSISSTLVVL